ncbi:unnamed protein product [Cunninghamella echinulata]
MSAYGNARAKDTNFRRTWDKKEYAEKAAKREAKERLDAINAERKKKGLPPLKDKQQEEEDKNKPPKITLKHREEKVNLDANLGKIQIVSGGSENRNQPGYYCELCDSVFKDSKGYMDNLNGKKHQAKLGVSMKVERAAVSSVFERLEQLKRKKNDPKENQEYDLKTRVDELKQQEHDEKERRKELKRRKKEEKRKIDKVEQNEEDDMAKIMGFGGFGSSKS